MSRRVLLLSDPAMERHPAPFGHIERPERLEPAARGVSEAALDAGVQLERRTPLPADDAALELVHDLGYVEALLAVEQRGGGWLDPDTPMGVGSLAAARLAAGGTLEAALAVMRGEASVAFMVGRPPGHHAGARRPAGFCLLNNVAVAAAGLRSSGLAERVAILDWDVHHGDGTQELFDADADVWYGSTHQWPFYPGSGSPDERGSGEARGTKHNVPLPAHSDDRAFVAAWRDQLLPALEAFAPQALLVSAGYDAHRDDPLGGLLVSEEGYRAVAIQIGRLATRLRIHGVALTLEGGYDLDALRSAARATVAGLLEGLDEG